VYLFREGALIQGEGVYLGKISYTFFTALPKFIKKHYRNLLIIFYRKLLAFLPKNGVTLPNFTLPKFTVTEPFFCSFTVQYRYRIFRKIIYRPTPSPSSNKRRRPLLSLKKANFWRLKIVWIRFLTF